MLNAPLEQPRVSDHYLDRRKEDRFPAELQAVLKSLTEEHHCEIEIVDTSDCGYGMEMPQPVLPGEEWELCPCDCERSLMPSVVVRIRWCKELDTTGRYAVGAVVV